ncbi:MAG: hypothetical protein JXB62_10780 [Pirellulales bacterium]|nr:hypothetical protein [Pirellulales bacterium]
MERAKQTTDLPDRWALWATWAGVAGTFLALLSQLRVVDLDMFHQMALFREALTQGWVPRDDVFAYTPTVSPVVHHEWGTGAVLYLVTVAAGTGAAGLMILKYLLAAATAGTCVGCARRRGADPWLIAWLAVPAMVIGRIGFTTIRAQVFTLLLLAVLLWLLDEDRRGRRWWIALWLPLFVLWLNLHAGFVVGFGLFGLHVVEQTLRALGQGATWRQLPRRVGHLAATGAAMVALLGVNPYGYKYVPYLLHAIGLERPLVAEWRPLWQMFSGSEILFPIVYAITLAVVVYAVACRGVRKLPGLLLVLAAAYLAARHFRHLSLYAVVWICYVPAYLEETGLERAVRQTAIRRKKPLTAFWLVVAVLGVIGAGANRFWQPRMPTAQGEEQPGVPVYPAGVVAYLAERGFSGNLMVPFDAGSFVSWKLFPKVKVSLDSRYEAAYPPEAADCSVRFYGAAPDWKAILRRDPTDAVLVARGCPLDAAFEAACGQADPDAPFDWRLVYRDDGFSLFARSDFAAGWPRVDRRGKPIPAGFP